VKCTTLIQKLRIPKGYEVFYWEEPSSESLKQVLESLDRATMKNAFLVQAPGYWGRGPTLKEAAQACVKAGARPISDVIVDLVIGDDKPAITNNGMNIEHDKDAQIIRIGTSFRLWTLTRLDTES